MAGLNLSVRGIGQIEESHRGLTYPLYARQLPEQLAIGAWQAVEARAFGEVAGVGDYRAGRPVGRDSLSRCGT